MITSRKLWRRDVGIFLAFLLAVGNIVGLKAASAADLPTVRVISPTLNPANDTFVADGMGQWFAAGGRSYFKYVGAGSTITLTYLVTSNGTTPWADKDITFVVNVPWSGSKAHWLVNGTAVGPNQDGTAGLLVKGKTDAQGKASFTIKNTDDAANAQPIPASETQARATTNRLFGQVKVVIDGLGDMQQAVDFLAFDITKGPAEILPGGATPTPSPTPTASPTPTPSPKPTVLPSIRLISPTYSKENSIDTTEWIAQWYSPKVKAWSAYIATGTALTLKYLVTKDGVTPMAKTKVTLQINAPWSSSKATWKTSQLTIGPSVEGNPGGQITGTTNDKGEVIFRFTNTNTTGAIAQPAKANSPLPPTRLYGTIKPIIAGYGDKEIDIDIVTFDIYSPVKTTITCVKGKFTKKVTVVGLEGKCPAGYTKK
jgi:hypothetical protein